MKKELLKFSSTVKLTRDEFNSIWDSCVRNYNVIAKKVWGKRTDNLSVYLSIRSLIPSVEKFKNELGKEIEVRSKSVYLNNLTSKGIFYLCSYHTHCAEGHKDYQGKMYVSENWEERVSDDSLKEKISAYIRNHSCMTIEDVVGDPVYMVTRPNCRHTFRRLDTDEVLHGSCKKLLKEYGMIREDVNSYDVREYRKYFERLKVLIALRDICSCVELERDIKFTRELVKKWKNKRD